MIGKFFKLFNSRKNKLKCFLEICGNELLFSKFFSLKNDDYKIYTYSNKIFFSKHGGLSGGYPISLVSVPFQFKDNDYSRWIIGHFVESDDLIFTEEASIMVDFSSSHVYYVCFVDDVIYDTELMEDSIEFFLHNLSQSSHSRRDVR
jgi:hypothetical protein